MWEDFFQALAAGTNTGLDSYMAGREREKERAEREAQRLAEEQYRQQLLDFRTREEQRGIDREERQRRRENIADVQAGLMREARDVLRTDVAGGASEQAREALGRAEGGLFGKAGVSPEMTYAAQRQFGQFAEDAEKGGIGRLLSMAERGPGAEAKGGIETPMSFMDRIPEFERDVTAREQAVEQIDGVGYVPTTPQERAAAEAERRKMLLDEELEANKVRLEEQADRLGLTGVDRERYIVTEGRYFPAAPEVDPLTREYQALIGLGYTPEAANEAIYNKYYNRGRPGGGDEDELTFGQAEFRRRALQGVVTEVGPYKEEVRRPYNEDELNAIADEIAKITGEDPRSLYIDYAGPQALNLEDLDAILEDLGTRNMDQVVDPSDLVRAPMLGADMTYVPTVRPTTYSAGQLRSRRDFANDNYMVR